MKERRVYVKEVWEANGRGRGREGAQGFAVCLMEVSV